MAERKISLTQLVHSTIGLSLVTQEGEIPLHKEPTSPFSPPESMAHRLQFNSKSSAGSVSSDKMALTSSGDSSGLVSNLDRGGMRQNRVRLSQAQQPSVDSSVFEESLGEPSLHPRLEPRPATQDRGLERLESGVEIEGIQDALEFLDKRASTGNTLTTHQSSRSSLATVKFTTELITWEVLVKPCDGD